MRDEWTIVREADDREPPSANNDFDRLYRARSTLLFTINEKTKFIYFTLQQSLA